MSLLPSATALASSTNAVIREASPDRKLWLRTLSWETAGVFLYTVLQMAGNTFHSVDIDSVAFMCTDGCFGLLCSECLA